MLFKDILKEQIDPQGIFSPHYIPFKVFDAEEAEFVRDHDNRPSYLALHVPPATAHWYWKEDDFIYDAVLTKEYMSHSSREVDPYSSDVQKRYKIVTYVYSQRNNTTGCDMDTTFVSQAFTDEDGYNVSVLDSFLSNEASVFQEVDLIYDKQYFFTRIM